MTTETETKPMTWDEREAKRLADARAWEFERDDRNEKYRTVADALNHERIKERDAILSKLNDERMDRASREQTAATILAALTSGRMVPNAHTEPTAQVLDDADRDNIAYAVALTDALRAKLAEVP